MNAKFLMSLGMNQAQASVYLTILKYGAINAADISHYTKIQRTNIYHSARHLIELGLIYKTKVGTNSVFAPNNPIAIDRLIAKKRQELSDSDIAYRAKLPLMLKYFHGHSEEPGVQMYLGKDDILEVFSDILRTNKTVRLIRSQADMKFYSWAFFEKFIAKKRMQRIKTIALTPNVPNAGRYPERDIENLIDRHWIDKDYYTAPVEWQIYGDKVALLSYGREAIATVINSPQIAESFRQIYDLAVIGAEVKLKSKQKPYKHPIDKKSSKKS